ncbi:MAG: alanine:cation symporter family protein, partial [Porcipelethomonas sp.]
GMGSAPLVASAAKTRNPVRQALVSSTGTFWDTVVVCLLTGVMLVSTIMKNPDIDISNIENGGQLTTAAFSQIPYLGSIILVVGIIAFAYSTTLGWSYYGEQCIDYLFGKKAILPYKIIFIGTVAVAAVISLDLVWDIANILNGLMAIPNITAVLLLSGETARDTKYYLKHLDEYDKTEIPIVDK